MTVVRVNDGRASQALFSISTERSRISTDQAILANASRLLRLQKRVQTEMSASRLQKRDDNATALLLAELARVAREDTVVIDSIVPKPAAIHNRTAIRLRRVPLRISITGPFDKALAFVAGVAGFKGVTSVDKIDVVRSRGTLAGAATQITMAIDIDLYLLESPVHKNGGIVHAGSR